MSEQSQNRINHLEGVIRRLIGAIQSIEIVGAYGMAHRSKVRLAEIGKELEPAKEADQSSLFDKQQINVLLAENQELRQELEKSRRELEELLSSGPVTWLPQSATPDQRIEEVWAMANNISQELGIAPKEAKPMVTYAVERPSHAPSKPSVDNFEGVDYKVDNNGRLRILDGDGNAVAEFPAGDWTGVWVEGKRFGSIRINQTPDQNDISRKSA